MKRGHDRNDLFSTRATQGSEPREPDHPTRSPSRGRAYVYVIPCRYDTLLKLGFSRDPLARMETLHPRYFEFFDMEAAFLIETERVADARRLETRLSATMAICSAPAPLVIPRSAAGHTEWYRGAYDDLLQQAIALSEQGFIVHNPLTGWLRSRLVERAGLLYSWSADILAMLTAEFLADTSSRQAHPLLLPVRHALDAYAALDVSPERWVSPAVWRWYQQHRHDFPLG